MKSYRFLLLFACMASLFPVNQRAAGPFDWLDGLNKETKEKILFYGIGGTIATLGITALGTAGTFYWTHSSARKQAEVIKNLFKRTKDIFPTIDAWNSEEAEKPVLDVIEAYNPSQLMSDYKTALNLYNEYANYYQYFDANSWTSVLTKRKLQKDFQKLYDYCEWLTIFLDKSRLKYTAHRIEILAIQPYFKLKECDFESKAAALYPAQFNNFVLFGGGKKQHFHLLKDFLLELLTELHAHFNVLESLDASSPIQKELTNKIKVLIAHLYKDLKELKVKHGISIPQEIINTLQTHGATTEDPGIWASPVAQQAQANNPYGLTQEQIERNRKIGKWFAIGIGVVYFGLLASIFFNNSRRHSPYKHYY